MDERGRRRNRKGRGESPRLNRWRWRPAESMPSPGSALPGRVAKPRPWPTGVGHRRPTRRGGGRLLRGCSGGPKDGIRKPATGGWRAGARTRDARGHSKHYSIVSGNLPDRFSSNFSSDFTRRSSFLISSSGANLSGLIPRRPSISRTPRLF